MTALHIEGVLLPEEKNTHIWVVDGRISFTPVRDATTVATRCWILPGLVDAHCHIGIDSKGPVHTVERARELAHLNRDAGVLALRDAGSPIPYPELDHDPTVPRLSRAGRHLAPPKRYTRGLAREVDTHQLPAATTAEAHAGNGWVKLVGDWIDREQGDLAPTYSAEAFNHSVSAAHAAGARVAVHTFAEDTLDMLIEAGVDSIEHGTGLQERHIDALARRGIALVPTIINIDNFPRFAQQGEAKFPRWAAHMRRLYEHFPQVVASAHEAGVPIYVGTDAGTGVAHGLAAQEIIKLSTMGFSAYDAIAAGSWEARSWLGFPPLAEGEAADLVCYARNPLREMEVLREPEMIFLHGRPLVSLH